MANDARNRLRSMGGIMASSPELMQAAQRFQVGGVATAPPLLDTTDEARAPRGFARSAYMSGLQGPPRRDVVADLINTSNATPFQEDIVANLLDTTDEARAARGFARSAYMSGLQGPVVDIPEDKSLYSTVQEDKAAVLAEKEAELEELIKNRKNPDIPSSSADKDNQKRLEDTIRRLEKNPEIQATREEELMSMPLKPELLTQEQIDRAMAIAQKDPNFVFPEDGAAEDVDTTEDVDTAADDDTPAPAPKPSKKDLRGRYEETIALFKDIFGEDDNDQARDRAMSLAMIGLAIAAGQSPNALTNVARGLMAGVQGIAKRRGDKRERERGLRSAALEAALAQEAAATKAEREAAQSQLEFEQEKELELLKGRLSRGEGYEAVPRPSEQAYVIEQKIREEIAAGNRSVPEQYKDNQEAFVLNERNKNMLGYIEGLGTEGQITDPQRYAQLGQMYMYRDVDPENPEAGQLPVVRSKRELGFILPGQSYLQYNPSTKGYTRETKPLSEQG